MVNGENNVVIRDVKSNDNIKRASKIIDFKVDLTF